MSFSFVFQSGRGLAEMCKTAQFVAQGHNPLGKRYEIMQRSGKRVAYQLWYRDREKVEHAPDGGQPGTGHCTRTG